MAVSQVSASSYATDLKLLQEGALIELLHNEESFFKLIKSKFSKGDIQGQQIVLTAKDALGHAAVKFIGYDGTFPSRQKVNYQNIKINPKFVAGHVEVERSVLALSKTNRGAWIDLMKDEISSKNQAMAQQLSRSVFGDGSGVIGTVSSVVDDGATGTITLSTASTALGSVYWFEKEDEYQILDASNSYTALADLDGSSAAYVRCKVIDLDNNKVTVKPVTGAGAEANWQPSTALAAGDLLVRKGSTYTSGATVVDTASEDLVGFDGIIDDATTTLFNIDRSATAIFKGQKIDCQGDVLQLSKLHQLAKKCGLEGGKPNMLVVSYDTYIRLAELGESMRSVISSPSLDVSLGIETIKYSSPTGGQIPITISRYCPTNKLYMIDASTFELRGDEPSFVEDDGQTLRLKPASGGGFGNILVGELFGMIALFSKSPNKSGKLINFTNIEA